MANTFKTKTLVLNGQTLSATGSALYVNGAPIGGGAGYSTIQDEGTPLTQRTTIDFVGAGVTASDTAGVTRVNIPGGAGVGGAGYAQLSFGAFPGASDASVTVTSETAITSGSIVTAWVAPLATADHSADEHMVETLKVVAGNIAPGTGFTIYGFNTNQISETAFPYRGTSLDAGIAPRVYGAWTVAWRWQ